MANSVAKRAPYDNWEQLEDQIAKDAARLVHGGGKQEHFAARQVAADLFRVKGFVKGGGPDKVPALSKLGTGARIGFYFNERAKASRAIKKRKNVIKVPKRLPYKRQTVACEYSKLVKRINFPHLCKYAQYKPARP